MKNKERKISKREILYDLIVLNSGIYFRALKLIANMKMSSIQHHIRTLERTERIFSVKNGQYKCFFSATLLDPTIPRDIFDKFRMIDIFMYSGMSSKILIEVYFEENRSLKSMGDKFSVSEQAVHYHLKKFVANEVVDKEKKKNRTTFYTIKPEIREYMTENYKLKLEERE